MVCVCMRVCACVHVCRSLAAEGCGKKIGRRVSTLEDREASPGPPAASVDVALAEHGLRLPDLIDTYENENLISSFHSMVQLWACPGLMQIPRCHRTLVCVCVCVVRTVYCMSTDKGHQRLLRKTFDVNYKMMY